MNENPGSGSLPATSSLERALARLLTVDRVSVLDRQVCSYASTFPCELVTCSGEDGRETKLHFKYTRWNGGELEWHRGVAFEGEVYRDVVNRCELPAPTCFGVFRDEATELSCLVLEHLDGSSRVSKVGVEAMVKAARWIGAFHARFETDERTGDVSLPEFDHAYIVRWAENAAAHTTALHDEFPLLRRAGEILDDLAAHLGSRPRTVIHGEYYPRNVLAVGGAVFPIDWETAARAAGEIDLAALIERWTPDVADPCVLAYRQSRWPGGAPPEFERTLCAARMLWHLRWLGSKPQKKRRRSGGWRAREFTELADLAQRLASR